MTFTLFADGGSRGNPGPAGSGAIVRDETGKVIAEVSEFLGVTTNNVAEYTGLVRALEKIQEYVGDAAGETHVIVKMDSMLAVQQMKGVYRVKHPNLVPLAARARELCSAFKSVSFSHVYREHNKEADKLANEAMDRGR
jgi:ribonuclease HI